MNKDELRPIKYDISSNGSGIWMDGYFHKWTEKTDSTGYVIDHALIETNKGIIFTVQAIRIEFLDR